jgi:site-specific DNA-methyltransferase (adenine-specific)
MRFDPSDAPFIYQAKANTKDRNAGVERNHHPTVKSTALMSYLCRLVTPPGGLVLDPFMGSGTTGVAALREGFNFIGIEREAEYFALAKARLEYAQNSKAET